MTETAFENAVVCIDHHVEAARVQTARVAAPMSLTEPVGLEHMSLAEIIDHAITTTLNGPCR